VFSLGAVLYNLLALRTPYDGLPPDELPRAVSNARYRPLRRVAPHVPLELARIVRKAMAPEPRDRFADAGELADEILRYLNDQPLLTVRTSWRRRLGMWARKHQRLSGVALGVLLALLVALTAYATRVYLRRRQAEEVQQIARGFDQSIQSDQRVFFDKLAALRKAGAEPPQELQKDVARLRRTVEFYYRAHQSVLWAVLGMLPQKEQLGVEARLLDSYLRETEFYLDAGDPGAAGRVASVFTSTYNDGPVFSVQPDPARLDRIFRQLGGKPEAVRLTGPALH